MNWKNKRVLITGNKGLIGQELGRLLVEKGANVSSMDIKDKPILGITMHDVTSKDECNKKFLISRPDYVFHLFGIKGNPKRTNERPIDFMLPMVQGDANIIEACQKWRVKKMLYTSSIAVENPETDKYPAWAKMTGEKLIEAMKIQYPKGTKYCIVRPSNVYGYEDLNKQTMVISDLIKQCHLNQLILDKEGSKQVRDFIHARDVAKGMIKAMEEMPDYPVNLCSGKGVTIDKVAKIIAKENNVNIEYKDLNLTLGKKRRVMKRNWDNPLTINIEEGLKEVCQLHGNQH